MGVDVLMDLLCEAMRRASCAEPERVVTLTVHLAERDGSTVAAAVLEARELVVSREWAA